MLGTRQPVAYVRCEIIEDFSIKGIWFRTGSNVELLCETADALAKAGKIRLLQEKYDGLHVR